MSISSRLLAGAVLVCVPALSGCTVGFGSVLAPASPASAAAPARAAAAAPVAVDFEASAPELRLAELMTRDPGQRRKGMRYSPLLSQVARQKAQDMARRGYFAHVDPDGVGANTLVLRAGFALPGHYDHARSGNNIESLGIGQPTPEAAWRQWLTSAGHRQHVLGLSRHFAEQTEFGVGYFYRADAPQRHFWVILTAPPAQGARSAD